MGSINLKKILKEIKNKKKIKKQISRLNDYPKNKQLENIHVGDRCFIVGTGTSILAQDLTLLKNEYVIAMSQLYQHKDYKEINSGYHILAGIKHHDFSDKIGIEYYQEIEEKIQKETKLFINYTDIDLIKKNNLLIDRDIFYCEFTQDLADLSENGIISDKALYSAQSISVMALQIALIMGFKKIYLVGLDHDWLIKAFKKESAGFYDESKTVFGRNGYVENYGIKDYCLENELHSQYILWKSYRLIKEYLAKLHPDVKIYYATKGGMLDVFEKVEYESLFPLAKED